MTQLRRMIGVSTIFTLLSLGGCSLPFNLGGSPKTIYRLTPEIAPFTGMHSSGKRLAIRDILSSGYIESHRVLFSRALGQVGSYQYAAWVELPSKQLTDILLLTLQAQPLFSSVSRSTNGTLSDLQLNAELLEFSHELFNESSNVHLSLRVEVIDLRTRNVLFQRLFETRETVERSNVDGAIDGFNRAAGRLISDVVNWLEQSLRA